VDHIHLVIHTMVVGSLDGGARPTKAERVFYVMCWAHP